MPTSPTIAFEPAAAPTRRRQVAALLFATALQFLTSAGAWTWALVRVLGDTEHPLDSRAGTLRWCIALLTASVLLGVAAGICGWRLWKPDPKAAQPSLALFALVIVVEIAAAGAVVWGLLMATVINEG